MLLFLCIFQIINPNFIQEGELRTAVQLLAQRGKSAAVIYSGATACSAPTSIYSKGSSLLLCPQRKRSSCWLLSSDSPRTAGKA